MTISSALRRLEDLVVSRWLGIAIVVVLAGSAFLFVRGRFVAPGRLALERIEHPQLDALEPIANAHLKTLRERADAIALDPRAPASHRARAYGELGRAYLAYDFPEQASTSLRNAAALDRDDFLWWYCLAHAEEQAGRSAEAVRAMATALVKMTTDLRATPVDIVAGYAFTGELLTRLDKPADARAAFEAALRIQPTNGYLLAKLGQSASGSGEHDKAVEYFTRALAQEPGHSRIRFLLAAEYRQSGRLADAQQAVAGLDRAQATELLTFEDPIRHALDELNLSSVRQVRLGAAQMKAGRFAAAIPFFVRAIQANPDNGEALTQYGIALVGEGRYEEAARQLDQALRKDASQEKARTTLITAYSSMPGYEQKAIEEALAWRQANPGSVEAATLVGDVYSKLHLYQKAYDAYSQVLGIDEAQPRPRMGRGVMAAALGRYSEARALLQDAADSFPNNEQVRHNLARLLVGAPDRSARDGALGLKIMEGMFRAQPAPIRAETLAMALAEVGRFDDAVARQRWAIEHVPVQSDRMITERLRRGLQSLEARKPIRESWPFADPRVSTTSSSRTPPPPE